MDNTPLTNSYGGVTGKTISRVNMDSALSKIATGEKLMSAGQTLKARVLDFMGKDLTLRLPNGTVVQARTSQGTALSIGQNAEFEVISSNHEQLLLRLINSDTANSANSIAGRALAAAGMPVNENNISLVNTLLENRLPVDADSIRMLAQQANAFKGTEVTTLAQMNKLNLPVNQRMIEQFNNYVNYEHQLMPQLSDLAENLASPELSQLLAEYGVSEESLDAALAGAQMNADEAGEQAVSLSPEQAANQAGEASAEAVTGNTAGNAQNTENINNAALQSENAAEAVRSEALPNPASETEGQAGKNAGALPENTADTAAKTAETAGSPKADGFLNAKETEGVNFLKRWTLTPEQLKKEGAIEEVFERLNSDLKQIASALRKAKAQNPDAEESLSKLMNDAAKTTQNLRDNLEFMNVLNRFFPYVQLPMRMEDKYKQGELYVYTRKKAKSQDGSASVLLHLDMDNLGPTDIYLSITGTTLGAKFYLADNEISDLFKENLPDLTGRLEKQGLTVNYELLPREEAENPVYEFLAPDENVSLKRYRFDCRA